MDDEAAVKAVLTPPQLARFRQVCDVDGPIRAQFDGWSKHALLTDERVFLFPRNHTVLARQERECAVYGVVEHAVVPRLVGCWLDPHISPYPFFAVSRLAGDPFDTASTHETARLVADLGAAMAACHDTPLDRMPSVLRTHWADDEYPPADPPPPPMTNHAFFNWLGGSRQVAERAAEIAGIALPPRWVDAAVTADVMEPVLTHGDLHQDQLLADETGRLTGILDWELSMVASPLADFTFSEWAGDLLDAEQPYGELRRLMWDSYAAHRSADLPPWDVVHVALALFDVVVLAAEPPSYYWQHSADWRRRRLAAARDSLLALQ